MSFPVGTVDVAWERIDALVAAGKLRAAMASTIWGARLRGFDTLLVCVFTDDWRDREAILRVRKLLWDEGFKETLGYKRDIDTVCPNLAGPEFIYTDADFMS